MGFSFVLFFFFFSFFFSFFFQFAFSSSPVPNFILDLNSVDVLVHPSIHRAAMDALGFHGIPHLATPPSHFSTIHHSTSSPSLCHIRQCRFLDHLETSSLDHY